MADNAGCLLPPDSLQFEGFNGHHYELCPDCGGTGQSEGFFYSSDCYSCSGSGEVLVEKSMGAEGSEHDEKVCPACLGTGQEEDGYIFSSDCAACRGTGKWHAVETPTDVNSNGDDDELTSASCRGTGEVEHSLNGSAQVVDCRGTGEIQASLDADAAQSSEDMIGPNCQSNSEDLICPDCEGTGTVQNYIYGSSDCYSCNGTGKLEAGGWRQLVPGSDIHFEYRLDEAGTNHFRGTVELPMPFEDSLECFAKQVPEKVNWSAHIQSLEVVETRKHTGKLPNCIPEDVIVKIIPNLPLVLQAFAGVYVMRVTTQHSISACESLRSTDAVLQQPSTLGEIIYDSVEWDLELDTEKPNGINKKSIIRPHPEDTTKSLLINFEVIPSWLPLRIVSWVLSTMVRPSLMKIVSSYYKHRESIAALPPAEC